MSEIRHGQIRQREVYWLDFGPVTGSAPADRHPCVVVQNDVFNRSAIATSVVCLITSNLSRADAPGNVLLKKGDGGLPKPSVVNVSQIVTVSKPELIDRIGKLDSATIDQVREGLGLLFDDWNYVSAKAKLLIVLSLFMKKLSLSVKLLIRLADSVYVVSTKR